MEKLIQSQIVIKKLMETFVRNYKKDGQSRRTKGYYEKRLTNFQKYWDDFEDGHKKLLLLSFEGDNEDEYFVSDVYSEVEAFYYENYEKIEARHSKEFDASGSEKLSDTTIKVNGSESSIRLPKISLEKFSGDYIKWPAFYDLFNALVHSNESLSMAQKLQYLKLHLVGEPDQLLRHFQITDNNYEPAWQLLNERYQNKRLLVNVQLRRLLNQNAISQESSQAVRGLLDTTCECLQALENLQLNTKEWDPIIVYLIVQKLPADSHQLWEQEISRLKDLPSWSSLKEFMESRFRALEAIASKRNHHRDFKPTTGDVRPGARTSTYHVSGGVRCPLCGASHALRKRDKFTSMTPTQRTQMVKEKRLCLNCLAPGHMLANCSSKHSCFHCKRRHHTLIHLSSNDRDRGAQLRPGHMQLTQQSEPVPGSSDVASTQLRDAQLPAFIPGPSVSTNLGSISNHEILLATALVRVSSPTGRTTTVRALVDQGSQASFLTERIVQLLHLPKEPISATVQGIGKERIHEINAKVRFSISSLTNEFETLIEGLVLKKITNVLPANRISITNWDFLRGLTLADPKFNEPGKIDLLIGADVFHEIILEGLIRDVAELPVAQNTALGWILSGNVRNENSTIGIASFHLCATLEQQLKAFWELEEISSEVIYSEEEKMCEQIYDSTTVRLPNGQYEVHLPFREETCTDFLGKSRNIALNRFEQLERRFQRNENLKCEYSKCLNEYVSLGHMTPASSTELYHFNSNTKTPYYVSCYLPHHGVIKESSTTTKLRVVFDASRATYSGKSLNDMLLRGPTVQDELAAILMRWRKHRIAFTADIQKMYRQIWVKKEHSEFQRILWREDETKPVSDFKLLTVTFGTKSAPYLATKTLKRLAHDEAKNYPLGSSITQNDFYVDDLLSGEDDIDKALEAQKQLVNLTNAGGLPLRKWMSNRPEMLETIETENCEKLLPMQGNEEDSIKTLGLIWNPKNDTCSYFVNIDSPPVKWTKRKVLSQIAKLFDPLGWLAPTIVKAKIFMQSLWLSGGGLGR